MAYRLKADQAAAAHRHYERNREAMKRRARAFDIPRVAGIRKYVRDLKESQPCTDCGLNFPYYVMQFDHVRGEKLHNVSDIAGTRKSLDAVKAEIGKCDLVCANCHCVRTHKRRARST